jgi:hypothetical protein
MAILKMAIAKRAVSKKREGGREESDAYAEEGVPDEVEREAVAGDEEEGELGVAGRQRRLLHLGVGLLRRRPRSPFLPGGALLVGGALQQEDQDAGQEEAEHQQQERQQQRRRALGPAVGGPPRLHPGSSNVGNGARLAYSSPPARRERYLTDGMGWSREQLGSFTPP